MELSLSCNLEKTQGNNGVASQKSEIHNPSKVHWKFTYWIFLLLFNFVCLISRKVMRTHSESPTVTVIYFTWHEVCIGTSSLPIDAYRFNRVYPNLKYKNFRFQGNHLHIFCIYRELFCDVQPKWIFRGFLMVTEHQNFWERTLVWFFFK